MNFAKKSVLLAASALSAAYSMPAFAQDSGEADDGGFNNDIVVTARRTEEKLQDVPISITVLSAEKLANNNITNAKDIANYTPGLTTNNRFGSDNTTWTIRGFAQEQRTTATVGTYFNDVVAPRGSGATQGGDGSGPGTLFDLANVQVLKGPQGTLQGRNSTGGAVLIVPKKPTDKLEGYLELQAGDYDMFRVQGVLNVPINDSVRVRLGFDRMKRDGYLQNVGKIGFGPHGDSGGSSDYWAARAGISIDLTPDIENYTVVNWSRSKSTGVIPKVTQVICREPYTGLTGTAAPVNPNGTPPVPVNACGDNGQTVTGVITSNAAALNAQVAYETANCGGNFWCVTNSMYDSRSESRTWQAINTTTWKVNDSLKIKNILSYGEYRGDQVLDLFGHVAAGNGATSIGTALNPDQLRSNVAVTRALDGGSGGTNAQSSFVEELQFQGSGDKFNWQGGFYIEINNPLGRSGTGAQQATWCKPLSSPVAAGFTAVDSTMQCANRGTGGTSAGRFNYSSNRTHFRDKAVYFQGMYDLTDQIKFTAGIRYTWDEMRSVFNIINGRIFPGTSNSASTPPLAAQEAFLSTTNNIVIPQMGSLGPAGQVGYFASGAGYCVNAAAFGYPSLTSTTNPFFPLNDRANQCLQDITKKTSAPTWLVGLDFKPMDNVLVYAKYSRGYRQGGVASFALDQLQTYDKEKVDTYEIGAKTSWRGAMPGYFNASAYINNFRDQQLQIGIQCNPTSVCPQTTAIINAGKSSMKGFEIEAGISPFEGFKLEASYAYLKTKLLAITNVDAFIVSRNALMATAPRDFRPLPVGSEIPNAQPHKLVLNASYTLPLDERFGKITFGGTMVYSSKYRVVSDPAVLDVTSTPPGGPVGSTCLTFPAVATVNGGTPPCFAASPAQYGSSFGILPGNKVFNVNVTWENVGSMPVDMAFFVTNITNEKYEVHRNVGSTAGYITSIIGEPKMWGVRLKYRFGN